MDGMLNLLKPPGMTSHDLVAFARRLFQVKRIGHSGTLDPGAAGVLVLGVGKATRLVEYLLDKPKAYRAELTLGITTDTQDAFGQILSTQEDFTLDCSLLEKNLAAFQGKIRQIPPMYSAVRHQGQKLYELARKGQEVERKEREVEIKTLKILGFSDLSPQGLQFGAKITLEVECSKGTYIRTLCHDLGRRLGCGAYMSYLVRTRVGAFTLENSWTLEELAALSSPWAALETMRAELIGLPELIVNSQGEQNLRQGKTINFSHLVQLREEKKEKRDFTVSNQEGHLIAIVKEKDHCCWQPIKVLC